MTRKISLQSEGFSDDAALDQSIKKLEADLKKARKKEAEGDDVIVCTTSQLPLHERPV